MNLHYDEKTDKANKTVERYLVNDYRKAIEKIVDFLSLEVPYSKISNNLFNEVHQFIDNVRKEFVDDTLIYYFEQTYINVTDCRKILISFYETIAQLEDIYLYKTIYKKSSFHFFASKFSMVIKNTKE